MKKDDVVERTLTGQRGVVEWLELTNLGYYAVIRTEDGRIERASLSTLKPVEQEVRLA